MIEMHSNYDNMHTNGVFYALICINNHVMIACYHKTNIFGSRDWIQSVHLQFRQYGGYVEPDS